MGRWCWGNQFHFQDKDGFVDKDDFYGDNEFPYIDIRLYPQDNWKEIISAYVRKGSVGGGIVNTVGRRVRPDDWQSQARRAGVEVPDVDDDDEEEEEEEDDDDDVDEEIQMDPSPT